MTHAIAWTMIKGNQRRSYAVVGSTIYKWSEAPFESEVDYASTEIAGLLASSHAEQDEREGYTLLGRPHYLLMGDGHFAVTAVTKSRTQEEVRSAVGALISVIIMDGEPV